NVTGAVLTQHVDAARTGLNPYETELTWANVPTGFGKLFTVPVTGRVFAEPLYAPQVSTASGLHDLVVVATEANNIYGIDAKDGSTVWSKNLGPPIDSLEVYTTDCLNIPGTVGITGTPVIDSTGTMFLVTANEPSPGKYQQWFHAIDVASGDERMGSPTLIAA